MIWEKFNKQIVAYFGIAWLSIALCLLVRVTVVRIIDDLCSWRLRICIRKIKAEINLPPLSFAFIY